MIIKFIVVILNHMVKGHSLLVDLVMIKQKFIKTMLSIKVGGFRGGFLGGNEPEN